MPNILILESNTTDLIKGGRSASAGFVDTLLGLRPKTGLTIVSPYIQQISDAMIARADGVIFTGSGVSWPTDAPEAAPLRHVMERVFQQSKPTWGSCNGLQLATVVLGGRVGASPNGHEVGLALDLSCEESAASHPMMAGRLSGFAVPCVHRDEVQKLPEGAKVLSGNAHSPVQAMVYERNGVDFWGVQHHPERSAADIGALLDKGLFENHQHLAADLNMADHDEEATERLGAPSGALHLATRATELLNWVDHVARKVATP